MKSLRSTRVVGFWAALALVVAAAWPKDVMTMTGGEVYARYCASCHGAQGKGDGPRAASCKRPPGDLTTLSERNGGVFPRDRVIAALADPATYAVTGMPSGSSLFSGLGDSPAKLKMIYRRLADHLETLQKPAEP